ncbi:MAG TPA: hypothetical protein VHS59_10160 [Bacillota bacterium]|nr:hypothetical protein [Bacillota bacterium]
MEERTGIPIASYFTGDTYDTPANTPRYTGDKLLLNSRWFFVASYLSLIWRCRGMAIKGAYDNQAWASSSWEVVDMVEGCGV